MTNQDEETDDTLETIRAVVAAWPLLLLAPTGIAAATLLFNWSVASYTGSVTVQIPPDASLYRFEPVTRATMATRVDIDSLDVSIQPLAKDGYYLLSSRAVDRQDVVDRLQQVIKLGKAASYLNESDTIDHRYYIRVYEDILRSLEDARFSLLTHVKKTEVEAIAFLNREIAATKLRLKGLDATLGRFIVWSGNLVITKEPVFDSSVVRNFTVSLGLLVSLVLLRIRIYKNEETFIPPTKRQSA